MYDYLLNLRRERPDAEFPAVCEIDTLLLLDREVDLVTPVATQLTYEGLIDEVFGIHNSRFLGWGSGGGRRGLAEWGENEEQSILQVCLILRLLNIYI